MTVWRESLIAASVVLAVSCAPAVSATSGALAQPARAAVQAVQRGRLPPVDDGRADAAFVQFRQRLDRAARDRDRAALESLLSPEVLVSFGPNGEGIPAFRERWRPDANPVFWERLQRVLTLGAAREDDGRLMIPYVSARWPDEFDSARHAAVTEDDVEMVNRPDGATIARLSYHIVRLVGTATSEWTQVEVPGGPRGYVRERVLYRPAGLRLECESVGGAWRIRSLVAGD